MNTANLSEWGKTLMHRLDFRAKLDNRTRNLGLKFLLEDERTWNSRLAVESLASNALNPDSPLFRVAREHLQARETDPLVLTSLLYAANHSAANRQSFIDKFLVRNLSLVPTSAHQVWARITGNGQVSWEEIATACRLGRRYTHRPADNDVEFYQACRWVYQPRDDNLASLVNETVGLPELAHLPDLRQHLFCWIFDESVDHSKDRTPTTLLGALPRGLWPELVGALRGEPVIKEGSSYRNDYVSRYAVKVVKRFIGELSSAERAELAGINSHYAWRLANELLPELAISPGLTTNLEGWFAAHNNKEHPLHKGAPEDRAPRLYDVLMQLPFGIAAPYLRRLAVESGDWDCFYSELPEESRRQLAGSIDPVADKLDAGQLADWLADQPDEEAAKAVLRRWIASYVAPKERYLAYRLEKLVKEFVIPWGIQPGALLSANEDHAEACYKAGYQLVRADLQSENVVRAILPYQSHYAGREALPESAAFWADAHWRDTLLDCGVAVKDVVVSALFYQPEGGYEGKLAWLQEHLMSRFDRDAEVRAALLEIAWAINHSRERYAHAQDVVIKLVSSADRPKQWLNSRWRKKVDAWFAENWIEESLIDYHKESKGHSDEAKARFVAKYGYSEADQVRMFLQALAKLRGVLRHNYDVQRQFWFDWLEFHKGVADFKRWLLAHQADMEAKAWLEWAIFLTGDAAIIRAARRYLDLGDSNMSSLVFKLGVASAKAN